MKNGQSGFLFSIVSAVVLTIVTVLLLNSAINSPELQFDVREMTETRSNRRSAATNAGSIHQTNMAIGGIPIGSPAPGRG
jgi:hypothetical protein